MTPWLDAARESLSRRVIDQGVHYRILFLGSLTVGATDIVACLSRSLRNLGHHVLDIDVRAHGGAVDNPQKLRAGHGPIYLRPDFIDPICRRFEPQIIVCCAGGLTLHPDHAERLKTQGIVLVGQTLSDPDVFPSVHAHVHVFDFHTTNASHSLGQYRAAGIHNTILFPFGIDRGFITQPARPAPELAADVICMGHASGRPERNKLMCALANEFDVKTYGRGWKLPGSETVQGERVMQAMRAGRIHINFPLTRAGFINVKCGVFESVGSGALLCTGRFDEMARFFRYDSEIIGYDDEVDLARQLRDVLASPERYAAMTQAAFKRVTEEHLYEHRWMALFNTIFNCSPHSTPWLAEDRIRQIRGVLATSRPRTKHVLLSGFYGARNLGDELILSSVHAGLVRADPSVQITVASENPLNVERDHGLQAFKRRALPEALHHARTASAIIVGGGGLWHDYTFARSGGLLGLFQEPQISMAGFAVLPLLGRMLGVPTHVIGMGIGPLTNPDAVRMLQFVADLAETVYVRDEESLKLLRGAGADRRALMGPDVVYALPLPAPEPLEELRRLRMEGHTLLGLNLRPWALGNEQELVRSVVEAIRALAAERKLAVVTIPMQAGSRHDESVLATAAEALPAEVPVVRLRSPLSVDTLTGALADCDLVMSMRLHACLMGHRLRLPVVGLAYDPKVSSHFAQIDRSSFCIPLESKPATVREALLSACAERGRLPDTTQKAIASLEEAAQQAMAVAARRIAELPTSGSVFTVPAEMETLRDTIAQLSAPMSASPSAALRTLGNRPDHAGSAVLRIADCTFLDSKAATAGLDAVDAAGAVLAEPTRLRLHLPCLRPVAGQVVSCSSVIRLPADAAEIGLRLSTNYRRDNYEDRLLLRVQIGEFEVTEDLTRERGIILLRFGPTRAQSSAPLLLRLEVLKSCFESAAWATATRLSLDIDTAAIRPGARSEEPYLLVSRGTVRKVSSRTVVPA